MAKTTLTFNIDGMHCDACISQIESVLQNLAPPQEIQVTLGQAVITLDLTLTSTREIITAICMQGQFSVAGFTSTPSH